ncbi:MAG: ABC transporter substrate-binding protein [Gammaproteobacteria bacterium]
MRRRTFVVHCLAAAGLAASLAAPGAVLAQASREQTLVVAVPATPASIDGEQALTAEGEMMMANIHGGDLFSYKIIENPQYKVQEVDLKATGDKGVDGLLAESWEMGPDGKSITIKLKQGVKSPYGNEFSAADYKWAWERRFEMKAVGKFVGDVLGIDGAKAVEVVDDHTVRVALRGPSPIFFKLLAQNYYGGPFDATEVKKHASDKDPWGKEFLRTHSAGYGPYHVEKVTPGSETILVANPNWGGPELYFKRIILKAVPESSARLSLLKAGQVDIAWNLSERELKEVETDAKLKTVRAPSNKQLYVGLVTQAPPLDNIKVRQALAWATPYKDIIEKVYYNRARRMTSTVPDIYAGYKSTYSYEYDLAKAKALLGEAGVNGFNLTLAYNSAQREAEEFAILLKSSWDQIGVNTTLRAMPPGVYAEQKYGKKLQAFAENEQWPWTGDPGYSSWVYLANGPDNFINAVNYNNKEYNDTIEKAMRMLDSPERQALTDKVQEIAAAEVPWIQVAWFEWSVAAKKEIDGVVWTPDNQLRFRFMKRVK